MLPTLNFEKPIIELEGKLNELRSLSASNVNISDEVHKIEVKLDALKKHHHIEQVRRAQEFIEEHFAEDISLHQVAAAELRRVRVWRA